MMLDVLSQLATDPTLEFFFKLAPIVTGIVVAITFFLNYTSYTKMRMMDQIKPAQDFFKDYREFKKQSADLDKENTPTEQRKDWAEEYFNSLEWFSYLVNTNQIKNPRLISMFEEIIHDAWEQIRLRYFTEEERNEDGFYPELNKLHDALRSNKIKVYRHKKKIKSVS